ncbi:Fido, protein-threonine AMPylation domain-containing protein [Hymenobacter daecheongensis DSM 21074]|uniref:protein adenylyltransferase n=1 Tax=Hymenobacter daecheongensis DSM 21074 TaxID=1121955 RepID=A0A1M6M6Y3_9BACT|nr:Fic family protein [Hymenobacter daecheongensis]SHJ79198.1 Fido, protein-threonine AMPylation domain-containing protein [Hymenobacter daecheongensis DSM 21074]
MAANDKFSDENGILLNKFGIKDAEVLRQVENDSALPKLAKLNESGGIQGRQFDHAHLKELHKKLFEDVYHWAGETRADRGFQGNKATYVTGFKETMTYAPHKEIEQRLGAIGEQLGKENGLKGLDQDKFTERAAYYMDQYNHTHAFREGNGRTLQAMVTQLGKEAGYQVDFGKISPEVLNRSRDEAMVRLYPPAEADKNLKPLREMLQQITTPAPGAAAEKLRDPSLAAATPELSSAMKAMDARRELEVTGYRAANVIANIPGHGNYDQGVKLAQRVSAVTHDPAAIKGPGIIEMQLAADKILKHPGMKDMTLDLEDARRLRASSVQVAQLAEGKELVTPQRPQQAAVPAAAERTANPAAIVPKTHEEAQPLFIKAAREVARGLEENGKGLDAARLREVARFVERSPAIAGMNQENAHKAMQAAGSIPSLSSNKYTDELRNSVSVLEKPPKMNERSGPSAGRDSGGIER